jgi:hypothetical protein
MDYHLVCSRTWVFVVMSVVSCVLGKWKWFSLVKVALGVVLLWTRVLQDCFVLQWGTVGIKVKDFSAGIEINWRVLIRRWEIVGFLVLTLRKVRLNNWFDVLDFGHVTHDLIKSPRCISSNNNLRPFTGTNRVCNVWRLIVLNVISSRSWESSLLTVGQGSVRYRKRMLSPVIC